MTDIAAIISDTVRRFGSEKALAEAAGVSQPLINLAKNTGRVGPKLAMGLEVATKGRLRRSMFRPDLWPPRAPRGSKQRVGL